MSGSEVGGVHEITASQPFVVGRDESCDIVLQDSKVSRQHCSFQFEGEELSVRDLDSRNGTFVNEGRIVRQSLGPGDRIRVGQTTVEVQLPDGADGADGPTDLPVRGPTPCARCGEITGRNEKEANRARRHLQFVLCPRCVDSNPRFADTIGNYHLLWKIARGGTADLYLTWHRILGIHQVLKIFNPRMCRSQRALTRFLREARIGAQLIHPNIVRFYDAGRTPESIYIAIEYVPGADLAALIKGGPIPPEFTLAIFRDILRALSFTHELGIIHRDIKPANILVLDSAIAAIRTPGEEDEDEFHAPQTEDTRIGEISSILTAKLTDFNISKALEARELDSSVGTPGGKIVGTIGYMSPEQIQSGHSIDTRTDLYSLGVTLYEAVTGRRPFEATLADELAYQILHIDPIPPSKIDPSVSAPLDAIILRAMARSLDDRYATPHDMLDDLNALDS